MAITVIRSDVLLDPPDWHGGDDVLPGIQIGAWAKADTKAHNRTAMASRDLIFMGED